MSRLLWSLSARRIAVATLFIAVAAAAVVAQASASEAARDPLTALRAATARYHSVNQALAGQPHRNLRSLESGPDLRLTELPQRGRPKRAGLSPRPEVSEPGPSATDDFVT